MAAATGPRKAISSIHDYPEHLNPFHEDDNHTRIRFWTIGRKLNRSNSINFSGIKDLKNSWALRSFMRKGKKGSTSHENKASQENRETSPIVYRRAMQFSSSSTTPAGARSTVGSPERADRYVYGGSVTPLPRSRFQERLRSSSQHEVSSLSATPRLARSEVSGSRLSVESSNPFEGPAPPARRKKKRAPLPPSGTGAADVSVSSENSELQIVEIDEKKTLNTDLDIDEMNLKVELKIVEDEDVEGTREKSRIAAETTSVSSHTSKDNEKNSKDEEKLPAQSDNTTDSGVKNAESEDDILNSVSFSKVDITKYRRNSSVNDDDIRLRRGNLEDFHTLTNKRSKSLTNASDLGYLTYDINLNENTTKDANGNEGPQKVICKLYSEPRKQSIDNSISSTEKEFIEIDKVRREFEREINKLNAALEDDFSSPPAGASPPPGWKVHDNDATSPAAARLPVGWKIDNSGVTSPNPIPKPRRSHYGDPGSPVNGNN